MNRKRNQAASIITVAILCAIVILSSVMVGCNKLNEQKKEESDETIQIPEPDQPDEDAVTEEEKPEDEEPKEEETKEETPKPAQPQEPSKEPPKQPLPPAQPPKPAPVPPPAKPNPPQPKPPAPSRPQAKDIVFQETGSYSSPATYRDGSVANGKITLRNKTFQGDLTIEERVGAKSVTLDNVKVEGTLYVYGGGAHSIKLIDCEIDRLVSDRDENAVRIYADGDTQVDSVLIKDDTILEEGRISRGYDGFKNVTVNGARGLDLQLVDLQLNHITTETRCTVDTDRNTSITQFDADAKTLITGSGRIDKLIVGADGVQYEKRPKKIHTEHGVRPPVQIDPDDDDEDDDDRPSHHDKDTVRLDSVSNQSLAAGASVALDLTTNASDLYASSSRPAVATVSVSKNRLSITANQVGSATITVNGTRSGYYSKTIYFTVTVTGSPDDAPKIEVKWDNNSWVNTPPRISFTVTAKNHPVAVELNKRPWQPQGSTNQYEFTADKKGEYVVTATDQKGIRSEKTIVVNLDQKAPEITKSETGGEFEVNGQRGRTVTLSLDDDWSNAFGIEVKSAAQTITQNNHMQKTYTLQAFYGMEYTIVISDQAGNRSAPKTIKIEQDSQAVSQPEIRNVTVENQNTWSSHDKKVSFEVAAPDAAPVEVFVRRAGDRAAVEAAAAATAMKGTYSFLADSNGEYQITASTASAAATHSVSVSNIDKTPPTIREERVEQLSDGQRITFLAEDAQSGIKENSVFADGQKAEKNQQGRYEVTLSLTQSKQILLKTEDNAGNPIEKTLLVSVPQQPPAGKKAPVISQISKSTTQPTNGPVVLSFTVTDEDTPVTQLTVKAGEQLLAVSNGVYSHTVSQNGTYIFSAQDTDGNRVEKTVEVTNIDQTPPVITSMIPDQEQYAQSKQVILSVSDAQSKIKTVWVDQQVLAQNPDGSYSFTAQENRSFLVEAVDAAGNTSQKQIVVSKIDRTKPQPPTLQYNGRVVTPREQGASGEPESYEAGEAIFTAVIPPKQDTSNMVSCEYFLGDKVTEQSSWKKIDNKTLDFLKEEQSYIFFLRTKDLAGNVSDAVRYELNIKASQTQQLP